MHLLQDKPGLLGEPVLDAHIFDLVSELLSWWQAFLFLLDPVFGWSFSWDGCAGRGRCRAIAAAPAGPTRRSVG